MGPTVAALTLLCSLLLSGTARAATAAEWRQRSIYQVLTDRFAREDGSTTAACNTEDRIYCGGSYQGIINKLDYIQDMGFTAIWISPIVKNIDADTGEGEAFHGYWAQDIDALNPNFGTDSDLVALSAALHDRGMYLMVDVVVNHMAYPGSSSSVDYSTFTPFNEQSYFHTPCTIDYDIQSSVEDCWLGDDTVTLPDLNTTEDFVRSTYYSWITNLVSTYSIDGLRLDTAKHVDMAFWADFTPAAGVYTVGEVFDGDEAYACSYQGVLDGVLNYPIYYQLLAMFESTSGSVSALTSMIESVKDNCPDSTLLATFIENHDNPRFPNYNSDIALAKNVMTYVLTSDGPPIIYEGQEQHLSGGNDPNNREAIWLTDYDTSATLYTLTASVNQLRNRAIFNAGDDYLTYKAFVIYSDSHNVALRKGLDGAAVITVLTNVGSSGSTQSFTVTDTGYTSGATIYDVLSCTTVTAGSSGDISVSLTSGVPKVFYPQAKISGSGICSQ